MNIWHFEKKNKTAFSGYSSENKSEKLRNFEFPEIVLVTQSSFCRW